MPALQFAGREFVAVGGAALFWPRHRALIVADLHLEKASWFAMRGQMLPPHDSLATLQRLEACAVEVGAASIWCLGDNFHDDTGPARLSGAAAALLAALTRRFEWRWITGNHDERLPHGIGGDIAQEAELDGIVLRHIADPCELRPELSGHFHPKHRAVARGRGVSRPCFVRTPAKLILPAFGVLTGGLDAAHPEIARAAGPGAEALVPAAQRLLAFPVSGRSRERRP